jgi:hypothetical protein
MISVAAGIQNQKGAFMFTPFCNPFRDAIF